MATVEDIQVTKSKVDAWSNLISNKKTQQNYRLFAHRFRSYFLNRELTPEGVREYQMSLEDDHSASTVSGHMTAMRRFLASTYQGKAFYLLEQIEKVKVRVNPKLGAMSDEEIGKVLKLPRSKAKSIAMRRDHALFTLLLNTGMRIESALNARYEDIEIVDTKDKWGNTRSRRQMMIQTKGSTEKDRYVLINDRTWKALDWYLRTRVYHENTGWLFLAHGKAQKKFSKKESNRNESEKRVARLSYSAAQKAFKVALVRAGIDPMKYGLHSCRRTYITKALDMGYTAEEISRSTHNSIKMILDVYDKRRKLKRNEENPVELGIGYDG